VKSTSLFAKVLVALFFYCGVMLATFVMPLLLTGPHDTGRAIEHYLDSPARVRPHTDLRIPQTDAPLSDPSARQAPLDKSGPDSRMITRPGSNKMRWPTVKA
jgi:hypothetical protein